MTIVSDYLPASTLHKRADDCPAGQTNILVTYLYNGVSWTTALELVYSERKITIYANNLFANVLSKLPWCAELTDVQIETLSGQVIKLLTLRTSQLRQLLTLWTNFCTLSCSRTKGRFSAMSQLPHLVSLLLLLAFCFVS